MCKRNFNHGLPRFLNSPPPPPKRKLRVRIFTKEGRYEFFQGGRIIELRYGYADLVNPKSYYHTWRAYATFLGAINK